MRCPRCAHLEDKVNDSRSVQGGSAIRRRRECLKCERRFTTYETIMSRRLRVHKRDGRYEDFQPDKLIKGIEIACQKRHVSDEQIALMVNELQEEMENRSSPVVETSELGDWVMSKLKDIDPVAYVRFASVYRRFEDVSVFLRTIERINER